LIIAVLFWLYRHRKIQKSRLQKETIKQKDAELDVFRDSIVGLRSVIKDYVPKSSTTYKGLLPVPPPSTAVVWCWQETPTRMSVHSKGDLHGEEKDCWIKYDDKATSVLETAYQAKKATISPVKGYFVDLNTMVQTKATTGFKRKVARFEETKESSRSTIDRSQIHGDVRDLPFDLQGEPQMVLVTGDVIQISKQRSDGWAFATKMHYADEDLARDLLESVVHADELYTDTGWIPLDATRIPSGDDLRELQQKIGDTQLAPPSSWDPIVDPTIVQRHTLSSTMEEYRKVKDDFLSTLVPPRFNRKIRVKRIERIQNLAMWQSYMVKRQTICYRDAGFNQASSTASSQFELRKALERFERCWLWHATNGDAIEKIAQQGFNRSFCGKNATMYGKGIYFARDSSYSASTTYAVPDRNGLQYMLACRVVVGEYCVGKRDALTPDVRDGQKNILYDSTVGLSTDDDMANPSIYVTYHDAQAYPEYLIVFQTKNDSVTV